MLADTHPDHERRLDTLAAYGVLDTVAEAEFDDIVALASKICDVPVSLISLVDSDRQWFKARVGFGPEQTTLDQSVCSHAILEDTFLEIEDMSQDPRTADNPLHVDGPQVNFYAGANLIAANGLPIGTLCVLDTKPRQLSEFQRQALKVLSQQVMTQLELRKQLAVEVALRSEMDHRVKNSLQTIASMLRVSARRVSDPEALEALEFVERRLGAVASLHSELMGQDGRDRVDAKPYLNRLADLLSEVSPETIKIVTEAVDTTIEARKASALGMIVSEFVANSAKYAFPDGEEGEVRISLRTDGQRGWLFECSDNGKGYDETADAKPKDTGLGEMLMSSAAIQLDGELETETGPDGTLLRIRFLA